MNQIPSSPHGCDFSRVKPWYLESKYVHGEYEGVPLTIRLEPSFCAKRYCSLGTILQKRECSSIDTVTICKAKSDQIETTSVVFSGEYGLG